jgi:AraC-like DNA-binding protein
MDKSFIFLAKAHQIYFGHFPEDNLFNTKVYQLLYSEESFKASYNGNMFFSNTMIFKPGYSIKLENVSAPILLISFPPLKNVVLDIKTPVVSQINNSIICSKSAFELELLNLVKATQCDEPSSKEEIESIINRLDGWLNCKYSINKKMVKVLGKMQHDSGEKCNARTFAKEMNISLGQFCKNFKKSTGLPFIQIRQWIRCCKVAHNVCNQKYSPIDSAYEFGFSDYAHFTKCFKKFLGLSPCKLYK